MARWIVRFEGEVEIEADCQLEAECNAASNCGPDNCRAELADGGEDNVDEVSGG